MSVPTNKQSIAIAVNPIANAGIRQRFASRSTPLRGELLIAARAFKSLRHLLQNFAPARFDVPHCGHFTDAFGAIRAPPGKSLRHLLQNFAPARLGVPHFEQVTLAAPTVGTGGAMSARPHVGQNFAPGLSGALQLGQVGDDTKHLFSIGKVMQFE